MDILANMSVVLGADISEFKRAMASAKAELKGLVQFGESLKDVGQSLSTFLTLPLALAGAAAVKAFDDSAKAIAQVEAGIKSTAGAAKLSSQQLQEAANGLQLKTLYQDDEILQKVTAQLLTFGNVSGQAFLQAQQAAIDLSARLGQDLQSSAIQVGKALDDPIKGVTALHRVGVSFSEGQKELIKTLVDTGQSAKAQQVILKALEEQYGGSAAAAAAVGTGPLKQLANQFNDVQESIGKIILDGLKPVIEYFKELIASFQALSPATQKTVVAVLSVAAAMGPLLAVVGTLITLLPAIRAGIVLLESALAGLSAPILLVVAAVAIAAYEIYKHWDELVAYFTKGEGGRLFTELADSVKSAFAAIRGALASLTGGLNLGDLITGSGILKAIFETIIVGLTGALNLIAGVIKGITDLFRGDFKGALAGGKQAVDALLAPIEHLLGLGARKSASISEFFGLTPAAKEAATETTKAGDAVVVALDKKAAAAAKKLAADIAKLNAELRTNTVLAANLPAFLKGTEGGYDGVGERIKILTNGLKTLVTDGLSPASAAFKKYLTELLTLERSQDKPLADGPLKSLAVPQVKLNRTLGDIIPGLVGTEFANQPIEIPITLVPKKVDFKTDIFLESLRTSDAFKQLDNEALAFGDSSGVAASKVDVLKSAIQNLLKTGVSPLDPAIKKLKATMDEFKQAAIAVSLDIAGPLGDSFVLLGQTIGAALSGSSNAMQGFLDGFISIIASFLGDFGKQLITLGVGKIAFEGLLKTPGAGPLAIAAGVALVALAGVASATLAKGPSGGGFSAPSGGSSFSPAASAGGNQAPLNIKVEVVGTLRGAGKDLVAILHAADYRRFRTS